MQSAHPEKVLLKGGWITLHDSLGFELNFLPPLSWSLKGGMKE